MSNQISPTRRTLARMATLTKQIVSRGALCAAFILRALTPHSGKKKAHKHKLFCLVGLGTTPGLSRGFHRVYPWDKFGENLDKPGFSPFFTQWKPDFTGFVPGTNPACPWDKPGDEGRHRKFM